MPELVLALAAVLILACLLPFAIRGFARELSSWRVDPLTRLPTARAFYARARREARGESATIVFVGVDLAHMTHRYGVAAADAALAETGRSLAADLAGLGPVGRVADDQFAAVVRYGLPEENCESLAERLLESVPYGPYGMAVRANVACVYLDDLPTRGLSATVAEARDLMFVARDDNRALIRQVNGRVQHLDDEFADDAAISTNGQDR